MSMLGFWFIGGLFTLGFARKPPSDFSEAVMCMLLWPLFLGAEIQERLDK